MNKKNEKNCTSKDDFGEILCVRSIASLRAITYRVLPHPLTWIQTFVYVMKCRKSISIPIEIIFKEGTINTTYTANRLGYK